MSKDGVLYTTTFSAPSNIAVVKYWGKRDASRLNLPLNSSLSVTMDQAELRAVTTIAALARGDGRENDRLWLNGKELSIEDNARVKTVLKEMRSRAKRYGDAVIHIVSANSFPTAAGLASSAAGYAALTIALSDVFMVPLDADLTTVARMGSGSACRSLYGGLVAWNCGVKDDGSDSVAVQMAQKSSWLDITILVLNAEKKHTSSTEGMVRSVKTSDLLAHRAKHIVAPRMKAMYEAYEKRDFETFGTLMMRDSNQFHATCLDTYPPVFYLTDDSRRVIQFVHKLNDAAGRLCAAYTFDAGPNAVIFTQQKDTEDVVRALRSRFPTAATTEDDAKTSGGDDESDKKGIFDAVRIDPLRNVVQDVLNTRIGGGPKKLAKLMLIDTKTALPKANYSSLI